MSRETHCLALDAVTEAIRPIVKTSNSESHTVVAALIDAACTIASAHGGNSVKPPEPKIVQMTETIYGMIAEEFGLEALSYAID